MKLCALAPWRETLAAILVLFSGGIVLAADAVVETVLKDLNRPCGIAVRPGGTADRFDVFIAESGAGRVVRWSTQAPQQVTEVASGFGTHAAADVFHQQGPLALSFLDPGLLVVGTTSDDRGDLLRAYELPDGEKVLAADATSEAATGNKSSRGESCTAMSRSRVNEFVTDRLFLAVRDANGRARLMASRVQAGMLGGPQAFGPQDAESPRAIAISNSGRVVVGDAEGGLTFCSPIDGKVELAVPTDLKQLIGLAYNPSSGSLYAADFAGGIHRIDDASQPGHPECRTVKVADIVHPTALTFGPDGSLYVVTFGSGDANGTLSIVTGDL
jgi:hypothetical protein